MCDNKQGREGKSDTNKHGAGMCVSWTKSLD